METIKWAVNNMPKTEDANLKIMGIDEVKKARAFHESFPQYSVTPLAKLDHMASRLGLKEVYVKDESYRFGLNAFKVLGGSFAMARYIAEQTGRDVSETSVQCTYIRCPQRRIRTGNILHRDRRKSRTRCCMGCKQTGTESCRTDAKKEARRQDCRIFWQKARRRQSKITTMTSVSAWQTPWQRKQRTESWFRIQPGTAMRKSRPGIMQGYGTMAMEADEQLHDYGCERPTHVFIQAGVGSLAGAVQGYFAQPVSPKTPPKVIVVEAEAAACLYKGACAGDGDIRIVDGDMVTIMAGLACGEPNTISWDILKKSR